MAIYKLVLGLSVSEGLSSVSVLAKLGSDHILGDVDRNVLLTVVDVEGHTNKLGDDGCGSLIGLDRLLLCSPWLQVDRDNVRACVSFGGCVSCLDLAMC